MQLEILKHTCDQLRPSDLITVRILHTYDITMSSVMQVSVTNKSGITIPAILKLYDRRFGSCLRDVLGKRLVHTPSDDEEYENFARSGHKFPFLNKWNRDRHSERSTMTASALIDGTVYQWGKYEAALWQQCQELFQRETKAYAWMEDLQGKSIPCLYAHIRLGLEHIGLPKYLHRGSNDSSVSKFWEIKGILLQYMPGCNLRDLSTSPLAPADHSFWPSIVQAVADTAHEINKRGVIHNDCRTQNVIVHQATQVPYIIDLAQCWFMDEHVEQCKKDLVYAEAVHTISVDEDPDLDKPEWPEDLFDEIGDEDPDVAWWQLLRRVDNPGDIGHSTAHEIFREHGLKIFFERPDYDEIIKETRRWKGTPCGSTSMHEQPFGEHPECESPHRVMQRESQKVR